jgi:hypothetical protein
MLSSYEKKKTEDFSFIKSGDMLNQRAAKKFKHLNNSTCLSSINRAQED